MKKVFQQVFNSNIIRGTLALTLTTILFCVVENFKSIEANVTQIWSIIFIWEIVPVVSFISCFFVYKQTYSRNLLIVAIVCVALQIIFIMLSPHSDYVHRYEPDCYDTYVRFDLSYRLKGISAGILLITAYILKIFEGKKENSFI